MAKSATKTKKATATNAVELPPLDNPDMIAGESIVIDIGLIDVSPFEAQARRRSHFTDAELDELGASIVYTKGFIHPPVVRPVGGRYEIVAGEQRFLAAKRIGYKTVEVKKIELADEDVRGMQLVENIQRKTVHPVDEGFDYRDLMALRGWDIHEISLQVGRPQDYILNRLKLTGLTEKIRKHVDSGKLPLAHALEIAKFADPETQSNIFDQCFENSWQTDYKPDMDKPLPLKSLLVHINRNYLLQLAKAPFDINATNLRKDGLACVACPDRTGAAPGLFNSYEAGKTDHCLNKVCYQSKIEQQFQNAVAALAVDLAVDPHNVPTINVNSYHSQGTRKELGYFDVTLVTEADASKKGVLKGISSRSSDYGQIVYFKMRPKPKASTASASSGTGSTKSASEQETFYKRKEEIWNVKVGEAVRKRVFALAAEKFARTFEVTGGGDTFTAAMCAKLLDLYYSDYIKRRIRDLAMSIIAGYMDVERIDVSSSWGDGGAGSEKKIAKFSDDIQKRLIYLLIHCHKGDMGSGSYVSQSAVKAIAGEWTIDYRLIDAQVRFELSAKKHKAAFEAYLRNVEGGAKNPVLPWLYSEKWDPKD